MTLLLASLAFADLPPPPGYVDTCTPEIQCGDIAARTCRGSFDERAACEAIEAEGGWVRMCQGGGASVWTEVFCQTAPDPAAVAAREARARSVGGRCGCATPAAAPLGSFLLAFGWIRRRRG